MDSQAGEKRRRERLSAVRVVEGVPLPSTQQTDAVLSLSATGQWLAMQSSNLHGRLLDIGCGGRPYADWYEPLVSDAVGIDAAPNADCHVRSLGAQLPFADDEFDVVLATEVLEHVEHPLATCREMFRVLRPGGVALVTVPFVYPLHEAPYDYQRFTHLGLAQALRGVGFMVESVHARGGPGLLTAQLALLAMSRGFGKVARLDGSRQRTALTGVISRLQAGWVHRFSRPLYCDIRGAAGLLSLGYMAQATKPRHGCRQ